MDDKFLAGGKNMISQNQSVCHYKGSMFLFLFLFLGPSFEFISKGGSLVSLKKAFAEFGRQFLDQSWK